MKLDPTDNPKLTAYALGELDDAELAEVEALLHRDSAARRWVDEVRATASMLSAELSLTSSLALTDARRTSIEELAATNAVGVNSQSPINNHQSTIRANRSSALGGLPALMGRRWLTPVALAASLVLAAGTGYWAMEALTAPLGERHSSAYSHGSKQSTNRQEQLADARGNSLNENTIEQQLAERRSFQNPAHSAPNDPPLAPPPPPPQPLAPANLAPADTGDQVASANTSAAGYVVADDAHIVGQAPPRRDEAVGSQVNGFFAKGPELALNIPTIDQSQQPTPAGTPTDASDLPLDGFTVYETGLELNANNVSGVDLVRADAGPPQIGLSPEPNIDLGSVKTSVYHSSVDQAALASLVDELKLRATVDGSTPSASRLMRRLPMAAAESGDRNKGSSKLGQLPSDVPGSFAGQTIRDTDVAGQATRLGEMRRQSTGALERLATDQQIAYGLGEQFSSQNADLNFHADGMATVVGSQNRQNTQIPLQLLRQESAWDLDADGKPEILFGLSRIHGDRETADFDPPDSGFCRKPGPSESYAPVLENPFLFVEHQPLSTFSIDVDTASYANVRRFLNGNQLPPPSAVRIEEMINYFDYDYPPPTGPHPFSVTVDTAECPWQPEHRLTRIGIKGKTLTDRTRPPANLVFLIDVSGSMQVANKLPLVKQSLIKLVEQLSAKDSVAIVTYAGRSGTALEPTSARNRQAITSAIDALGAGGSTNGAAGIQHAYQLAADHFIDGGANRVILATDGDFNVGVTGDGQLTSLIEEKAKTGVFLSVLGFGMGNLKDSTLELLADKGNGNYAYIDNLDEAEKVLVGQVDGTLFTIAKDVKIQVEFNPAQVEAYRLIGYENRMLRAQDFNNDAKDAGEIGAGHTVTALYEIVPAGMSPSTPGVDPLKYQKSEPVRRRRIAPDWQRTEESAEDTKEDEGEHSSEDDTYAPITAELMTVKLRYKQPDGDTSELIEVPVVDMEMTLDDASPDFRFAASVASFGLLLRDSTHVDELTFESISASAGECLGSDPHGDRAEFLRLVDQARLIMGTPND